MILAIFLIHVLSEVSEVSATLYSLVVHRESQVRQKTIFLETLLN